MHVIRRHHAPNHHYFSGLTALSDQISRPLRHSPSQHLVAVLRDPDQVVLDVVDRMRSSPILTPPQQRVAPTFVLKYNIRGYDSNGAKSNAKVSWT